MSKEDEDLFDAPVVKEIVNHFTAEKETDINKLIEYAFEMKEQKEEAEKEYKLAMDNIKAALKLDKQEEKKKTYIASEYNLIVTRRNGSVKFLYDKYIEDNDGVEAIAEIEQLKALAKEGKADSKYIEVGDGSIAVEIVKSQEPPKF